VVFCIPTPLELPELDANGWSVWSFLPSCVFAYVSELEGDEFSSRTVRGNHINGIEGFWGYAKTRMSRFRGMHPSTFYLHLKECEFRYNHRGQDLYHVLLKLCRENPLS
jgi:transposase